MAKSRQRARPDRETLAITDILARNRSLRALRLENLVRIGSTGNPVYRVDTDQGVFAVRFPNRQRFVECAAEFENQRRAFEIDLAPRPVVLDERTGAIVSEWLPGAGAAREIDVRSGAVTASIGRSLARLHCLAAPFFDILPVEKVLDFNLDALPRREPRIEALATKARIHFPKLDGQPARSCHGDPTLRNWLIDDDARSRLVDWEYSHGTAPAWDLAIVCNELEASGVETRPLEERYAVESSRLGGAPINRSDLRMMQGVTALVTAAWCIRYESSRDAVDRSLAKAEEYLG